MDMTKNCTFTHSVPVVHRIHTSHPVKMSRFFKSHCHRVQSVPKGNYQTVVPKKSNQALDVKKQCDYLHGKAENSQYQQVEWPGSVAVVVGACVVIFVLPRFGKAKTLGAYWLQGMGGAKGQ